MTHMKKYLVQMRDRRDNSLIENLDKFDSYEEAEEYMDDYSSDFEAGADDMENSGMADDEDSGYINPSGVYFRIVEVNDD